MDRLLLTPSRIRQMAEGLRQVVALDDPIGEVLSMKNRPNGLTIGKKRVPIGVVGMIYEARPNVTADAFGLCFKTGNAVILKGGSDALYSNMAMVASIKRSLKKGGRDRTCIRTHHRYGSRGYQPVYEDERISGCSHSAWGAGLIRAVVNNATVPVIETGTGNCHIYVDETADLSMAGRHHRKCQDTAYRGLQCLRIPCDP